MYVWKGNKQYEKGTQYKMVSSNISQTCSHARYDFLLPNNGYENAKLQIPEHIPQIRYLQEFSGFPIYTNSSSKFLTPGEKKFEVLKDVLEKAEKYIFLEYFIFVSDDMTATAGTTNLDFRSLYLYFECGAWLYNSTALLVIPELLNAIKIIIPFLSFFSGVYLLDLTVWRCYIEKL